MEGAGAPGDDLEKEPWLQSLHLLLESHRLSLESSIREHCREAASATSLQLESLAQRLDELSSSAKLGGNAHSSQSAGTGRSSVVNPRSSMTSGNSGHYSWQQYLPHAKSNRNGKGKTIVLGAGKPFEEPPAFDFAAQASSNGGAPSAVRPSTAAAQTSRSPPPARAPSAGVATREEAIREKATTRSRGSFFEDRTSRLSELLGTSRQLPKKEGRITKQTGMRRTFQQTLHKRRSTRHSTAVGKQNTMGAERLDSEEEVDELVDDDLGALVAAQGRYRRVAQVVGVHQRLICGRVYDEMKLLDTFSMTLIVTNMLYMATEADITFQHMKEGKAVPDWLFFFDIGFLVAFLGELAWRLKLQGRSFCSDGSNRYWNIFDVFVITLQIVDVIFRMTNMGFVRSLRVLRAIRAARIIRTIRYVRELRLMVASIFCSLGSLVWALVLLVLALFLFSMCLMQTLQVALDQDAGVQRNPKVMELYGSVPMTMLSLFMAITGGRNWAELTDPLLRISHWYMVAFVLYVTFVLLGMLNILTAVFVESTNKIAEVDAELVVQEQMDRDSSALNQMRAIFLEAGDADGSECISQEDFDNHLNDPRCSAQLELLDLDVWTVRGLFKLLDMDGCGVHIEELVYAMMRLRGSAKAVDVATLLYENKRIISRLSAFMSFTEDCFLELKREMASMNEACLQGGVELVHTAFIQKDSL